MAKNTKKLLTTLLLIFVLLILAFIPGRDYIANKTFKEALAFNKAISIVNMNINTTYKGAEIKPQYIDIIPLNGKPRSLHKRYALKAYKNKITEIVSAHWVKVDFEGTDKNGAPKYFYHISPVRFAVVVLDVSHQIVGSTVVSVLPNKPVLDKTVDVVMRHINGKTPKNGIMMDGGGGYSILEQYKDDIRGDTKIAYLHSTYKERTSMIFQPNSIVYIQSKARFDTGEPLTSEWQDNGAVATPALNYAGTGFGTGYITNGANMMVIGDVRYAYERYKYVVNGYVYYWEHIFPECVRGSALQNPGTPNKNTISGLSTYIGAVPGAYTDFPLLGEPQYYFTPAVVISFGVNYGESGGTIGMNISLSAQRHYAQKVLVHAVVTGNNAGKKLYGFDANTKWGETFFAWSNR